MIFLFFMGIIIYCGFLASRVLVMIVEDDDLNSEYVLRSNKIRSMLKELPVKLFEAEILFFFRFPWQGIRLAFKMNWMT